MFKIESYVNLISTTICLETYKQMYILFYSGVDVFFFFFCIDDYCENIIFTSR